MSVTTNETGKQVAPRSSWSRSALVFRLLALGLFVVALARESGLRWVLVALACGLLVIPLVWRRKATPAASAVWTASADLIKGSKHAPGQLSFTPEAVVWSPSSYSLRHGHEQLVAPLPKAKVALQAGPGLLDAYVDVRWPGRDVRFLTRRSPRLRRAVRQLTS
jgi:hypothetical protein